MKFQGIFTGSEEVVGVDFRLRDLEEVMTPEEKQEATTLTYRLQALEPGLEEAYIFNLPADALGTVKLDDLLFQPVEIETRGYTANGFVRGEQKVVRTDQISLAFTAISIQPFKREELLKFNKLRSDLAKDRRDKASATAERLKLLRTKVQDRITKQAAPPAGK
jgi:hypothetical protein